jgi:7-cyano-7-deazaguanine synthase
MIASAVPTALRDEITAGLDVPTGRTVLLFSGGMDSLMLAHLLNPHVLLYVRHGARYEAAELAGLERVRRWLPGPVTFSDLPLGHLERPDANHGEDIVVGAMDGDRSLDKSPEFFRMASELLTYLYGEQHWCVGREVRVRAPFKDRTKTQLVRSFVEAGGSPLALKASFSCYDPAGEQPCGQCKPCFRKWVALENNGIGTDGQWDAPPWEAPWLRAAWPRVAAGSYRGAEDADWVAAMQRKGAVL